MTTLTVSAPVRFHVSLNVSDLGKAVAFYRVFLGVEPAKRRHDYAKFELDDPPLVLSLEPHRRPATGGALNHAGFRVPDSERLVAMQGRLEASGLHTEREEGVECCYARQTKFWVKDPDQTLWEVYVLEEDIDHRGMGSSSDNAEEPATEPVAWEHRLGQPIPSAIPLADESADEVRLRGSFNVPLTAEEQKHLLQESYRILKPGGSILWHTLVADQPLDGPPRLSGPAAWVQHVPLETEGTALLAAAGFVQLHLQKLGATPCFQQAGVEMRECQLTARKPLTVPGGPRGVVVYRGPFSQVTDDFGQTYHRGKRVAVEAGRLWQFQTGPLAEMFTIIQSGPGQCSG